MRIGKNKERGIAMLAQTMTVAPSNVSVRIAVWGLCIAMAIAGVSDTAAQSPSDRTNRAAIDALMAAQPTTPSELVRAADTIYRLGDPALAKTLVQRVAAMNLPRQDLSALVDEFGSPLFVRMGTREDWSPEGRDFAQAVLTAFGEEHSDPANLQRWIAELSDPTDETRFRALNALRNSRGAAVAPMVKVLADASRSGEHEAVLGAMVHFKDDARWPLVAILSSDDPQLVAASLRALGHAGSRNQLVYLLSHYTSDESDPAVRKAAGQALMQLLGATPDKETAAALLASEAALFFEQQKPLSREMEGQTPYWEYDDATGKVKETWIGRNDAYRRLAARFAREAYSVLPEHPGLELLHLTTSLEDAAYRNGLDNPLPMDAETPAGQAAEHGVEMLTDVAMFAMAEGRPAAATAAVRILGQIGSPEKLLYVGADPGVLAQAAKQSDRRLRYAAVEAIMALAPEQAYPGASDVLTTLLHIASSEGRRIAVVAGPRPQKTSHLAGQILALGYEAEPYPDGRKAIERAAESADVELVILDPILGADEIKVLVQQFNTDNRTGTLPIGVFARPDFYDEAEDAVEQAFGAVALPWPVNEGDVAWSVEQVALLGEEATVPPDLRQQQADQAMAWLVALYADEEQNIRQRWQDVQARAIGSLYTPSQRKDAIEILRRIPTPEAQTALADYASRFGQPIEDRKAALDAFIESVRNSGVLLTQAQVVQQYTRYNATEFEDQPSQEILGLMLDVIEAKKGWN